MISILPFLERFNYESSLVESPCNSTCPKECRTIEYITDVSEASFPNEKYQEYYAEKYDRKKSYIRYAEFKFHLDQVKTWCLQAHKPLPDPMLHRYLAPYGNTKPQWVYIGATSAQIPQVVVVVILFSKIF